MATGPGRRPATAVGIVLVAALSGCGRESGPVSTGGSPAALADITRVAPGEETAHLDLPGVAGFDDLAPELKAQVLERANRSRCDCGCAGHSVSACLHQDEACDVARRMAVAFVDDARALALLGAPGVVIEDAPLPAGGVAGGTGATGATGATGTGGGVVPVGARTGAGVMSAAGPEDEDVGADPAFAGATGAEGLPAADDIADDAEATALDDLGPGPPPQVPPGALVVSPSGVVVGPGIAATGPAGADGISRSPGATGQSAPSVTGATGATGPVAPGLVAPMAPMVGPAGTPVLPPGAIVPPAVQGSPMPARPPGAVRPLGSVVQPLPAPSGPTPPGGAP